MGGGCKGFETDSHAHRVGVVWQACWFHIAGEGGMPFARAALVDGERFDLALDRTMVDHLDAAHLGKANAVVMRDGKARLRKGEAIIAILAFETWVARFLGVFFHLAEEGFESQ